ncbi:MAG: helix-turn-helix domain-containing protein [Spirochaetia bacterium]|nr:helix-turn-helix domain-containing protein [Spirochaetia bacterium]
MTKAKTQTDEILEHLQNHTGITTLQSYRKGITRLSARIYDLKQSGYNIDSAYVTVKNRYGTKCSVKKYFLVKE